MENFQSSPSKIFVFGSNLAGRHGSGAAYDAMKLHGAKYGIGVGLTGNSYAIPTKGFQMEVLQLNIIKFYVDKFLSHARLRPNVTFMTTAVGCGLAGYTPKDIAPMFAGRPFNVKLPMKFIEVLYQKLPDDETLADIVSFNQ